VIASSSLLWQILMKMQLGAGHFSKSGRYDTLKEDAFEYAVIIDALGASTHPQEAQT
jgi:protease II